ANVMQQEVTVRVEDFIAQRSRNSERARSNRGACGRRGQRGNMANVAADVVEQGRASHSIRRSGQRRVARRHFGCAYESREMVYVVQAFGVRRIVVGVR